MSIYCYSIMYQWCHICLWQALVPTCINACPHLNKPEFQPLSQVLFVSGALGSWSPLWKQINLCMNIHHDNCCHPLDKKSPAPVNHGRPSKSNIGDKLWCPMWDHTGDLKDNSNKPSEDVTLIDTLYPETRLRTWTQL